MKTLLKKYIAALAAIFIGTAVFAKGGASKKQSAKAPAIAKDVPLNFDPSIKVGKLQNGMTYFIKKNDVPKNRIFLNLVVKIGSAVEEENERGVAHFIEHLAFNGTEHFEKNEIDNWFEKIGMNNDGNDMNAFTSFEETVYMLEIPADDPEILKTAMLILHDWASAVTFPQEEVDKERGVVQEEWRLRDLGADGRIANQSAPFMLKGSAFENRFPIGKMDVIKNITRQEIINFYKKWYRPEIMSVIVVGDAEVAKIESEIKNAMSSIPASENPISLTPNRIPHAQEKQIKIITDPEQKFPSLAFFEHQKKNPAIITQGDLFENIKQTMAINILNLRANEITNTPTAKWLTAEAGIDIATDNDAFFYFGIIPKEGMFADCLKTFFDEYDRAEIFGVTDAELKTVKSSFLADLKNYLTNKNRIDSSDIVSELEEYFITGGIRQSVEEYCKICKSLLELVTVENVNECIKNLFADRGTKLLVVAPKDCADLPSEKELMEIWRGYKSDSLSEYSNDAIEKLMERPAQKAAVKSQTKNKALGVTEYVLDNGIKIITKKTGIVKNQIIMQASSKGGNFQISDADFPSTGSAVNYAISSGFMGISFNQISKFLTDKKIEFDPSIQSTSESITGSSTNEDFEYLLQLVNLMFTSRQYTDDVWQMIMDYGTTIAKKHGTSPDDAFEQKINELIFGKNDLRHAPFDMKMLEKMNPDSAKKIVEERFANAADFTFIFVGDFNEKKLIELCKAYLGTLPTTDDREEIKYLYWNFPKGKNFATVKKGIDEKGRVFMAFGKELPPQENIEESVKDSLIASQLSSLLDIRLREVIREEKGGSYGIGTDAFIDGKPERYFRLLIEFGCEPNRCEELSDAALNVIKEIQTKGTSEDNIQKLREIYRRNFESNIHDNRFWLSVINAALVFEEMPIWLASDVETPVSWITSENLQAAAKKYLDTENYVRVFLKPE